MRQMARPRKAIFPVGGLGTRFLPATKAIPKEMLPIIDQPLIQYAFEEARLAGCEEFIFVTGSGKSAIENHFDNNQDLERARPDLVEYINGWLPETGSIAYLRQRTPRGLGHALWCARKFIRNDEVVAVLLADDFIPAPETGLPQMVDAYRPEHGSMVLVREEPASMLERYGVIDPARKAHKENTTDRTLAVHGLIEKPPPGKAPSNLAIIGRYILHHRIFALLDQQITTEIKEIKEKEIQITDALAASIENPGVTSYLFQGSRMDCGTPQGFLEANLRVALERPDLQESTLALLRNLLKN